MRHGFRPMVLGVMVAGSAHATDFFEAPITASHWEMNPGPMVCQLSHRIPGYGLAVFRQTAGKELEFVLQSERNGLAIVKASLSARAPAWMHGYQDYRVYPVALENDGGYGMQNHLLVRGATAERMLDELGRGRFPTFTYLQESDGGFGSETRVAVSAINFFSNYEGFLACRRQLPAYGLQQVRDSLIFFDPAQSQPNARGMAQLQRVIQFAKAALTSDILISSAIEAGGEADKQWFATRRKAVQQQLLANGLEAKRIRSNEHGSSLPSDTLYLKLLGPEGLSTYYYRGKETGLGKASQQRLALLASYFRRNFPEGRVVVRSYTDTRGSSAANQRLSQQRADKIKRFLELEGIDSDRISIRAYGESRSQSYYREGASSRRVEIDLLS